MLPRLGPRPRFQPARRSTGTPWKTGSSLDVAGPRCTSQSRVGRWAARRRSRCSSARGVITPPSWINMRPTMTRAAPAARRLRRPPLTRLLWPARGSVTELGPLRRRIRLAVAAAAPAVHPAMTNPQPRRLSLCRRQLVIHRPLARRAAVGTHAMVLRWPCRTATKLVMTPFLRALAACPLALVAAPPVSATRMRPIAAIASITAVTRWLLTTMMIAIAFILTVGGGVGKVTAVVLLRRSWGGTVPLAEMGMWRWALRRRASRMSSPTRRRLLAVRRRTTP